ncbi:two-component system phosphate regulon sensor histidine kinase PhoR [Arthrobacter sp. UYCu511]|uniref:sensor histidine kinase n=1 Tax=Arthrobacter sp. UYCu511 TaxID=3156337 RepID=UPI0033981BB8
MPDTHPNQLLGNLFYRRTLRGRVIFAQLPFFLTVALAGILIAALYPGLWGNPRLLIGLTINALLAVACFVVPWDKLHPSSIVVIPYLDFIVVAFFREGSQTLLSSAGLLGLFPVFWLCASGIAPKTAVVSSTVASLSIVWVSVFISGNVTAVALAKPLLFPLIILLFAITVVVITSNMEHQRNTLLIRDKQLREALAESQHRERLMETVVDTVGVGVLVVDADGNDQLMNAAQRHIHSLGSPVDNADPNESELLVFSPDREPLAPESRPVRRAINGETFTNFQIWIGTGEEARALSTTARMIRHGDGASEGSVIAFHDVTDMVKAMNAKNDFVANVSHEFRTPLTAIQSYISLVLEEPDMDPQDVARFLGIAERNADRLSGLVADLLTNSAITVERAPANVAQLLSDCLASAAPSAAANNVILEQQCQEPLVAFLDGVRISQVLDNLVSNAIKYSPHGGTLTVKVWTYGTDLHCEVSDQGLGMSESEQASLFQKFYRAGTAVERGIPGIGLGLTISKTIIETHGGTLSVLSHLGKGTTMKIVIPACVLGAHFVSV